MLRHILQSGHPSVTLIDFKILGKGFKSNRVKKKILVAISVKQYWSILNTQENAIYLELFS